MLKTMDICEFLQQHAISYTRFDHEAVFTTAESSKLPTFPGADTKNLFLCDRNQTQFFLVTVPHDKRVDLRALGKILGAKDITFGSAEKLQEYLGVMPGSVTLLGLMNDTGHHVHVSVDASIWNADAVQAHPLINSATLVIPHADLERFFAVTGHDPHVLDVPARSV